MSWWKFWQEEEIGGDEPDYYAEGVALVRQERYHEALTSFRLALRERPDDASPLEQMGVVYTRIGMTEEAVKAYRKALERKSDSPGAHYGLGFLLLNRDRHDEASFHLNRFLECAPDQDEASRHVEHARETLERIRSAGGADGGEPAADAGTGPAGGAGGDAGPSDDTDPEEASE